MKSTVAVDFDGVLHPYTDGWVGSTPADEPPMEGTAAFLRSLLEDGYDIVVFSSRAADAEGRAGICDWMRRYGLYDLVADIVHTKPLAVAYIDDRAIVFDGSWDGIRDSVHLLDYRWDVGDVK